ncbi:MAG: OmpH/Skp family outer membrane protein [Planctomycetota bacterium]|jgi:Skp family chaperone for outer membrane proteins
MRVSRKYLLTAIGAVVGFSLLAAGFGQATPQASPPEATNRIGVCDIGEIFEQCQQASDLNEELRSRREALRVEDAKRTEAAQDLSLELKALKPGSQQYASQLAELQKMQIEQKNWREFEELRLRRWHLTMTKDLYGKVVQATADVAKARGIQIVLDQDHKALSDKDLGTALAQISQRKVLYSDPSVDLTAKVLARMNEGYRARRP